MELVHAVTTAYNDLNINEGKEEAKINIWCIVQEILDSLDKQIRNYAPAAGETLEGERVYFDMFEIDWTYRYNIIEESEDWEVYLTVYDYRTLLADKNIIYTESRSGSIYIETDEGVIRLSNHKRPSYEHGGAYYDHEYYKEIIINNPKDMLYNIKKIIAQYYS